MKKLYIIGGTMGVGKTSTCQVIKNKLNNCVFLDGDWCWDMHPFQVTEETKTMVIQNICFLLNNFIKCSAYEFIVFGWVMHQQEIIDTIVSNLDTRDWKVYSISLICNEKALLSRLQKDIHNGIRVEEGIQKSMERLPQYALLNTIKVDVSDITPEQAADIIIRSC